ncbi:CLAVATA3/ESR (CLE)-related protein 27 [Pyrus ussuriensis x Pyrus communis]|uniref:CLAVATA3/ESR (CLE)-related protein 27 n=1 Tax=Pyrus ussuriensis x Pyrus communis TaxID=2448454 RepID=A0A5N5G446_9ROSA|nr:CLAVATA3/ESR (CLE)-related protein 27 [Pyrus ussuriensis x Pyrus communis]
MSFAGCWRLLHSSLLVILVVSALQIWVCCDCRAGAIRVFPGNTDNVISKVQVEAERNMMEKKSKTSTEALFQKYFGGSTSSSNFNKTEKGHEESKRRVPSCPDKLHN